MPGVVFDDRDLIFEISIVENVSLDDAYRAYLVGASRGMADALSSCEKWLRNRTPFRTGATRRAIDHGFTVDRGIIRGQITIRFPARLYWPYLSRVYPRISDAAIEQWLRTRGRQIVSTHLRRAFASLTFRGR